MIYKIGNMEDVKKLFSVSDAERKVITKFARILSDMYGSDRDIDNDYGGYILFAPKGTSHKEIKAAFDYEENLLEYAELHKGDVCAAVYITSTEYGVVLIMSMDDAPKIIREALPKTVFKIGISETLSKTIDVEAVTTDEAITIAKKKYKTGEVILTADDFIGVSFEEVE